MINLYLDESGSMELNPRLKTYFYFYIAIVQVHNKKVVEKRYKNFISSNLKKLKKIDDEKYAYHMERNEKYTRMFVNGKFVELKGTSLTKELKIKFLNKMCEDNAISVYLIKVNNRRVQPSLYANKARAFNFILKTAFIRYHDKSLFPKEDIFLHCDNRNVSTNTLYVLEEYLNTELSSGSNLFSEFKAEYLESENSRFVQIADVFANVHYSSMFVKDYDLFLNELKCKGNLVDSFEFLPDICKK